jgi:hypothetical protein
MEKYNRSSSVLAQASPDITKEERLRPSNPHPPPSESTSTCTLNHLSMLMHTRLVLLLHLLILNLLEHRSLVTTFPDSLFGIFTPALPSELGTSGDKPGLTKVHRSNTAMTISDSSSPSQIRDSMTYLGPKQLIDSLQVLSDGLGDKGPHGDRVRER